MAERAVCMLVVQHDCASIDGRPSSIVAVSTAQYNCRCWMPSGYSKVAGVFATMIAADNDIIHQQRPTTILAKMGTCTSVSSI